MSHVVNDENIKMLARNIEFKTIVGVYLSQREFVMREENLSLMLM